MSIVEDSSTPRYAIFTVSSDWCFEGTYDPAKYS